jgi:hypothetical protein
MGEQYLRKNLHYQFLARFGQPVYEHPYYSSHNHTCVTDISLCDTNITRPALIALLFLL